MSGFIGASNSRDGVIDRSQPLGKVDNPTFVAPTFTGAAVLGTPASGVVTNLSGVLPAAVTGGSGLTALGTVTAGNLANTSIVYPVGHVIQTVIPTPNTTVTNFGSGANTYHAASGFVGTITPRYSNSKIIIQYMSGGLVKGNQSAIRTKITGTTTSVVSLQGMYVLCISGSHVPVSFMIIGIDTPGDTNAQTYQLHLASEANTGAADARINQPVSSVASGITIVQEIKQ
tara:strand:- start:726 stop:1415 length:690 start_codon:yes stop_codon:yes gene_type:complete